MAPATNLAQVLNYTQKDWLLGSCSFQFGYIKAFQHSFFFGAVRPHQAAKLFT